MPLIRFSAVEQRGLLVPAKEKELLSNVGTMAMRMAGSGIQPVRLPGGESIDITPPYWRSNVAAYWVETEPADPPEACIVHVVPKVDGGQARQLSPSGRFVGEPIRTFRIPADSSALPLLSPDVHRTGLLLHELILPLPNKLIEGLAQVALQARRPA